MLKFLNVFVIKTKIYQKIYIFKNSYPIALLIYSDASDSIFFKKLQKIIFNLYIYIHKSAIISIE